MVDDQSRQAVITTTSQYYRAIPPRKPKPVRAADRGQVRWPVFDPVSAEKARYGVSSESNRLFAELTHAMAEGRLGAANKSVDA